MYPLGLRWHYLWSPLEAVRFISNFDKDMIMFAVIKTGGKQYKVFKNDILVVEKLSANTGDIVQFEKILMIGGETTEIGMPELQGAAVHATVLEQKKDKKVISFKKRRRKHSSKTTRGHRQNLTVLKVTEVMKSGADQGGTLIETGSRIVSVMPKPAKSTKSQQLKNNKGTAETSNEKQIIYTAKTTKKVDSNDKNKSEKVVAPKTMAKGSPKVKGNQSLQDNLPKKKGLSRVESQEKEVKKNKAKKNVSSKKTK